MGHRSIGFLRCRQALVSTGQIERPTVDITIALGMSLKGIGPVRSKLIKKGISYSPGRGDMAFTVPLFDEFLVRVMPEFLSA